MLRLQLFHVAHELLEQLASLRSATLLKLLNNVRFSELGEVYGWFTEGFGTRDLKEGKVLLEELAA